MGIKEWWSRLGEEQTYGPYEEEFQEENGRLTVRVFDIKGEEDADDILEALNTGKIIALINSRHMKNNDELKNIILRVKGLADSMEGKIVGLPDKWFLVTPKDVDIFKKQE